MTEKRELALFGEYVTKGDCVTQKKGLPSFGYLVRQVLIFPLLPGSQMSLCSPP